jgi:sec-independent protein translocase protein TatC
LPESATEPQPIEQSPDESLQGMSFLQHLEELRKRIIWSLVGVGVGFGVCFWYAPQVFDWMQRPIVNALQAHKLDTQLVYTSPTEPFNLYLKIGLFAGIFFASPWVLYQVWQFISPGLYRKEKRYVLPFMFSTVALFLLGGLFAYFVVYPAALDFLIGYGGQFKPMITIDKYTDLFLTLILGMGLIFEMPILIFFLSLMGVVSAGFLWRNFRYSILIIFIIAGIVTPTTDIMNMCIFAAPMIVLYIFSIAVAYFVHPAQRLKREQKAS